MKSASGYWRVTPIVVGIMSGVLPGSVRAQGSVTPALEEIVVTARKRTESLQDVPISVSVLSSDDLVNQSAIRILDAFNSLPNVSFESDVVSSATITIRGVNSDTNNFGVESAVGVYVDEVYLPRPTSFNQTVLDIERIEVLRGPQGTLWGKNTVAGVVSITTERPADEFTLAGDLTYGRDDLMQARGSVSGPVSDNLGFRLSGGRVVRDGWFDQRTPGLDDLNDEDSWGVRGQLRFAPSERLEMIAALTYSEDRISSGGYEPASGPFFDVDGGIDDSIATSGENSDDRDMLMASLTVNYQLGSHTLTAVTGYQDTSTFVLNDQDYTAINVLFTSSPEQFDFFSQELRLASGDDGPLGYVMGLYYSSMTLDGFTYAELGEDTPIVFGIGEVPGYVETVQTDSSIDADSYAAFASLTYDLTDRVSATAGLRYTDEKKSLDYRQNIEPFLIIPGELDNGIIGLFAADVEPSHQEYDDDAVSGDLTLRYEWRKNASAYLRYSRGFKAGGFDTTQSASPDAGDLRFGPEFVDMYELGVKTDYLASRMRLNASVFQMDFTDKQEQFFDGVNFRTSNAASASVQGFELEATAVPLSGLTLYLGVGYADAKYDDFVDELTGDDFSDNRLPNASKWSGSTALEYVAALSEKFDWYSRVELTYRSAAYTDNANDPRFEQDEYSQVNLRFGLEASSGAYGIYAWGRNIADERHVLGGFELFGSAFVRRNPPATWGIELRARF